MAVSPDIDTRTLLKSAYLEIKGLRSQLAQQAQASSEPIAVVGAGCRFPGGVVDADSLWAVLRQGIDTVGLVPQDRWDIDSLFDADPDAPGKVSTRHGAFLDEIGHFDAGLFGISPLEAASMDPQQRLLLEVAWEALENAAISLDNLRGSRTGVFVGMMYQDYLARQLREIGHEGIGPYLGTGATFSAAVGRLSYVLGLQGPSLAVDTACSSSLVSLHLACQSLRSRECEAALAGGVNLMLTPEATINLSKARMMSPTGRCRTFDAAADGYIRGEGCGLVVLKRLAQAQADGDRILGLVRGSAVNQDGRSNGLTAPNGSAQRALLREALAAAGAKPEDIGYVECHGTGTPLGDPIEVGAIVDVHGLRPADRPLAIGSAKTNFGHMESAAGICGFLKALLVLHHREIPPHLHLTELNPHIRIADKPIVIPTELTPWFQQHGERLAAVSSFGFVGTNAHVILQGWDAAAQTPDEPSHPANAAQVLTLSAATGQAVQELAEAYAAYLDGTGEAARLADICFTANTGRADQAHRLAVVADSVAGMADGLRQHLAGANPANVAQGVVKAGAAKRTVFLFTGQGAQYLGVGHKLYQTAPVFRATLDRCAELLRPHLPRPLLDVLFADPQSADAALLDQTGYTQPALFALEYALFEQWRAWGVMPDAVAGHSVGEYAAACAAGVFSVEDGLKLIAARGRLMQALPAGGGMAALSAPEDWVLNVLAAYPDVLSLAAVNAPNETVVSGAWAELREVAAQARQAGFQATELKVSHGFHSPLMRPMLDAFRQVLDGIRFQPAQIPLVSNLTGRWAGDEIGQPAYWLDHVLAPVRFWQTVETLRGLGEAVLLEIGPRPVLTTLASRILGPETVSLPSLRQNQDDAEQIGKALAGLYSQGVRIDWAAVNPARQRNKLALPTYRFQRERHWIKPSTTSARKPAPRASAHLLGEPLAQLAHQPGTYAWAVDAQRREYLWEHQLMGQPVWPISAQLELALAAARDALGLAHCKISAFEFQQILYTQDPAKQQVQAVLVKTGAARADFSLFSRALDGEQAWTLHSRARIEDGADYPPASAEPSGWQVAERSPAPFNVAPVPRTALQFSMMFFAATEELAGQQSYRLILDAAKYADDNGFHGVWVPERHFTDMGSLYPNPSVLHAALARETRRVRLMAGSVVLPLHNPIRIAEEWAMVDNLSGGRVGLAVASGWNPGDFVLAPDKYPDRYQHLYEGIELLRRLWRGETHHAIGADGKAVALRTYPTPVQAEMPLWMTAARSPESFKKAGAMGLNLLTHLLDQDIATLAEKIALYRQARAEHGHDPEAGWVSVMCHTFIAPDVESVHRLARQPFCDYLKSSKPLLAALAYSRSKDIDIDQLSEPEIDEFVGFLYERFCGTRALIGTPDSSLDMVNKLHEAGVNEIACLLDFGPTTEQVLAHLPHLNRLREDYAAQAPQHRAASPVPHYAYAPKPAAQRPNLEEARRRCVNPLPPAEFYQRLAARGVVFDGSLQGIARLHLGDSEALAEVPLPVGYCASQYVLHPSLLDACLQAALAALLASAAGQEDDGRIFVPTRIGELRLLQPVVDGPVWSYGRLAAASPDGSLVGDLTVFNSNGDVLFELHGLQVRGINPPAPARLAAEDHADWLYAPVWRPLELAADSPLDPAAPWLVLADTQGVARAWAQRENLVAPVFASVGSATAQTGATEWTLNPDEPDAFGRLFAQIGLASLRGILCAWPLDGDSTDMQAAQRLGVETVTALARTLAQQIGAGQGPKLWIATRGAQAAGAVQAVDVAQAPLWGFAGALARELPGCWGGIIDLDADAPQAAAADLQRMLRGARGEDRLAVRAGQSYAQRLVRAGDMRGLGGKLSFRADGCYLVAGGLGGLSLSVAAWMAERGAGQVVLLGRSALPDAQILAVDDPRREALTTFNTLVKRGVKLSYAVVDIADEAQVAGYLAQRAEALPIRGFVHAAGVYHDEALVRLDHAALWKVLNAKVLGAWVMHRLLPDTLEHFLLFSSFSALTPPHGQAAYAAACAFLDALAHARVRQGLPGLSINWGAWSEVGFAASAVGRDAHARLEAMGMRRMTPEQALAMLQRVLAGSPPPQIAVFPMDVWAMAQADPLLRQAPLLAELGEAEATASQQAEAFLQALRDKDVSEQRDFLLQDIHRIVADVLQIAPVKLPIDTPLTQLGLDSLIAVHLKNRLQKETGFDVPLVSALNGGSVASMADELMLEWRMGGLLVDGQDAELQEAFEV